MSESVGLRISHATVARSRRLHGLPMAAALRCYRAHRCRSVERVSCGTMPQAFVGRDACFERLPIAACEVGPVVFRRCVGRSSAVSQRAYIQPRGRKPSSGGLNSNSRRGRATKNPHFCGFSAVFRGGLGRSETILWWPGRESNPRHGDFQSPALPTELPGHVRARNDKARCRTEQAGELARGSFLMRRLNPVAIAWLAKCSDGASAPIRNRA